MVFAKSSKRKFSEIGHDWYKKAEFYADIKNINFPWREN
jgi:hypothetical protein